jgi:V-type H+-transporting ATPase subunit H
MGTHAPLQPSPVAEAFLAIQECPVDRRLRLTSDEERLLRTADENPLDYTLARQQDAAAYARILLKVLGEASLVLGSTKVSQLSNQSNAAPLSTDDALKIMETDSMGVMSHYALTKLHEVIASLADRKPGSTVSLATTFFSPNDGSLLDNYRPLVRALHAGGQGDSFAQSKTFEYRFSPCWSGITRLNANFVFLPGTASLCLARILVAGCPSMIRLHQPLFWIDTASVEEPLHALILWLVSQMQSSSAASLPVVTPTLIVLAACPEAREMLHRTGGIGYISRHLRIRNNFSNASNSSGHALSPRSRASSTATVTTQQLYELCFCVWTLTYDLNESPDIRTHFCRDGAVAALVDLVAVAPREKVVRMALSALRNLASCTADLSPQKEGKRTIDGSVFLTDMIGCGLIKSIDLLKERQWTDPDFLDDLKVLHKLLHENYKEMTTWDVYKAELDSGHLEWGVVHTETFFRHNVMRMEGPDSDFSCLKRLILLAAGDNEDVAAVACFDIGEFVRHYPNGRTIAKRLGAIHVVMTLLNHEHVDLQRHALLCISKLMVRNWEAVQK